jgi:orotidine-5'-phosphate decarboxylase
MFKVGSQLFTTEGPRAVQKLAGLGFDIFLDLKFHDIPNTVAGAIAAAAKLPRVRLVNVHASGGVEMMRSAREAVGNGKSRPALLAVTILTSLDAKALRAVGMSGSPASRAIALAQLARSAGMDGVVASAQEVKAIRRACGPKFLIVVPGIRPAATSEAIRAGADYLVVGRPITAARDPRTAALAVAQEIATASAQNR